MNNRVAFTVYFPNRRKMANFLKKNNIEYEVNETSFITWFHVDALNSDVVNEFILSNKLQDGMKDEFKWNGWIDWADGYEFREKMGRTHY
jgi:hypothetical protein